MSAALHIEPVRYGITGIGLGCHAVRTEFHDEAVAYSLDAPALIPRGSLRSRYHELQKLGSMQLDGYHYVTHTDLRA